WPGVGRRRGRRRRRRPGRPVRGQRHDGQLSLDEPGWVPVRGAGASGGGGGQRLGQLPGGDGRGLRRPRRRRHARPGGQQLLWRIDLVVRRPGPGRFRRPQRGIATGDLDNDGRVDAVLVAQNEPLVYLHNVTGPIGRSLTLRLEGTASNRDAVAAVVRAVVRGRVLEARRVGGGSYLSAGDPR